MPTSLRGSPQDSPLKNRRILSPSNLSVKSPMQRKKLNKKKAETVNVNLPGIYNK
jgi:hypothetical protein